MRPVVSLSEKYLQNCQFVFDRYVALNKLPSDSVIAEVGVLAGDLSEWLVQHKKPKELHLIDVFDCDDYQRSNRFTSRENEAFVRKRFETQIQKNQVYVRKGLSWEVLATYPNQYFDWIYVDAAHDYKSVRKDLNQVIRKIKPDGYIIMNDYILVDHVAKTEYGVVQATNEFCVEHDWEFVYFAFHPTLFCDVVLRKINQ